MGGERETYYIPLSKSILTLEDLTLLEKVLLARIASFDIYFESKEACAELFGVSPESIRRAKVHLTELGYIEMYSNTGHGKKYRAQKQWLEETTPPKVAVETVKKVNSATATPKDHPKVVASTSKRNSFKKRTSKKWDRQYPHLIDVRDRGLQYLKGQGIPCDINALQTALVQIDEMDPNSGAFMIETYFDYLESPSYLYQVAHNKYCPRISSVTDLSSKFARIRTFKNDKSRHYDPNKNLTT